MDWPEKFEDAPEATRHTVKVWYGEYCRKLTELEIKGSAWLTQDEMYDLLRRLHFRFQGEAHAQDDAS